MGLRAKLRVLKSALKYGGFNSVNVNQVNYGDSLEGKNILITGGGSGIGFTIARKCVMCGAKVLITGRNEEKLCNAIDELGKNASYLIWDQTDIKGIPAKFELAIQHFDGRIDCLVNNAGIQPSEFFPNVSEAEWDKVYDTNSKGVFFLTQELCKVWMQNTSNGYKKVINVSSQGGFVGATYPYRMTKWDVRGLTQGLGEKMAPYGILVNAIAPGVVKTEMQKFSIEQGENTYCNQNLLNRVCLPEEVAELAVFMLGDSCNFMVGQTILIDGGYSIKRG